MRFFVNTQDLRAGISTVIKALPSKTSIPILEGIYLEAEGDSLLLRCNDLSLQIDTRIPATVERHGSIVIDGKFLAELARKLPDENTCFDVDKTSIRITSGRANTVRQGSGAEEYHSMAQIGKEYSVTMSQLTFKNMIRQTIFAAAQDESKPVLTGALFELNGNDFSMVALDGYRLALRNEHIGAEYDNKRAIIPRRSLIEISRILTDEEKDIKIDFSKTHILIDLDYTSINVRLIDGEYIKYKQILPESHETRVRVRCRDLLESIERAAIMARENKSNLVKFTFETDKLTVSANSEVGKIKEEIEVDIMGKDIEIAFNANYFIDVLNNLDDEEVYMDFNNSISPCVVRPLNNNSFYYLILPVRLSSDY